MVMYQYIRPAQTNAERLNLQTPRPPESIIVFLRNLRRLLTVGDVAKILSRHPETVYGWIAAGGLPASKQGRTWRIDPIRLAAWLEAK